MKYKLAYVGHGDFRCAPRTLYNAVATGFRRKRKGETFLIVSKSGHRMFWVIDEIEGDGLDYRSWDLPKSRPWHPWMISEYAKKCGLQVNVRDFNSYLAKRLGGRTEAP